MQSNMEVTQAGIQAMERECRIAKQRMDDANLACAKYTKLEQSRTAGEQKQLQIDMGTVDQSLHHEITCNFRATEVLTSCLNAVADGNTQRKVQVARMLFQAANINPTALMGHELLVSCDLRDLMSDG